MKWSPGQNHLRQCFYPSLNFSSLHTYLELHRPSQHPFLPLLFPPTATTKGRFALNEYREPQMHESYDPTTHS